MHTKHLLIVDDERYISDLWKLKFTKGGFQVDVVMNGDRALEKLNQERYDVILLDLRMPGKDGLAVLQERRSTQNADTPLYVVTSTEREDMHKQALALGARKVLLKHCTSPQELMAEVESALTH